MMNNDILKKIKAKAMERISLPHRPAKIRIVTPFEKAYKKFLLKKTPKQD